MKFVKISSHEKRTTMVYVATYVAACASMASHLSVYHDTLGLFFLSKGFDQICPKMNPMQISWMHTS